MADTLFLVHGMGNHQDDWAGPVTATLHEAYAQYPRLARIPFEERFRVVSIRYDQIFRTLVSQWQQNAAALGPAAPGSAPQDVENLVGWLRQAGELGDNFAWTHCADVLLFRLFYTVRQAVLTHVARQLAEGIKALKANERWSVIAHSLGTAVSHGALDMLWTGTLEDGGATGFEPLHDQALLVMMVANVSRVLQTHPKVLESTVKPGVAGQAGRGCLFFLNMRHRLDPFPVPKMFDPQQWPDPQSATGGAYRCIECRHIHQANVHGFEHYLVNPAVHIPMFRCLSFSSAITGAEEAAALARFKPWGALSQAQGIALQGRLEQLLPALADDWQAFKRIWDRYHDYLGQGG